MRHISLLALLSLALVAASPKVAPPAAGHQAPDFTLLDQNRKPVSLAAARGRKAVLVFYRGYW